MRDYINYELQKAQPLIEALHELEEPGKQDEKAQQKRRSILNNTQSPSAIYQFFDATGYADGTAFRNIWQERNLSFECLQEEIKNYYKENFETPKIDLTLLPPYSFVLQFAFTLAQPYISRDEQDFYIIPNPVRKDRVFNLPYVASTSWKGSLRAALGQPGDQAEKDLIVHLFGNEKGVEDQKLLRSGCLYFYPTFFTRKSIEVINPQNRELRSGEQPIPLESVPKGTTGVFTLLYVPDDLIGQNQQIIREAVGKELRFVAKGLQAREIVIGGILRLRFAKVSKGTVEVTTTQPVVPALPRYLETPDRLKAEYLTPEGTFRERSEAELKKMSKNDRQLYDKARGWWQRREKQLAEAANLPQPTSSASPEPISQIQQFSWPEWSFRSFEQLVEKTDEVANMLLDGGAA
jgi:CRISPR-associated protein Cmr2